MPKSDKEPLIFVLLWENHESLHSKHVERPVAVGARSIFLQYQGITQCATPKEKGERSDTFFDGARPYISARRKRSGPPLFPFKYGGDTRAVK